MKTKSTNSRKRHAKRRLKKLREFYLNLAIFLAIGTTMIVASYFKDADSAQLVPKWVAPVAMFVWACLLIIKALHVFDNRFIYKKSWEEKKINEYLNGEDEETTLWE